MPTSNAYIGVPSVITMAAHLTDGENGEKLTVDKVDLCEGMKKLEAAGADVVGLNCANGPETILDYMELIKNSGVKVKSLVSMLILASSYQK